MMKIASLALAAGLLVGLSSCSSFERAAGAAKNRPDEFRILTKAPLEIPPEYNLVPPRPGEPRPQELATNEAARVAMLGGDANSKNLSVGEQILVQKARGNLEENNIRAVLDSETNRQTYKTKGFADRIMFWKGGDNYIEDGTMLNADKEAERLRRKEAGDKATGGKDVVIEKKAHSKLPGL